MFVDEFILLKTTYNTRISIPLKNIKSIYERIRDGKRSLDMWIKDKYVSGGYRLCTVEGDIASITEIINLYYGSKKVEK